MQRAKMIALNMIVKVYFGVIEIEHKIVYINTSSTTSVRLCCHHVI